MSTPYLEMRNFADWARAHVSILEHHVSKVHECLQKGDYDQAAEHYESATSLMDDAQAIRKMIV